MRSWETICECITFGYSRLISISQSQHPEAQLVDHVESHRKQPEHFPQSRLWLAAAWNCLQLPETTELQQT